MSDSGDIPVFIRNPDGEYLAEQGGEWRFTSDRSQAHVFGYDELLKRDKVNLDIFWEKDEALEQSANLPAPEITDDQEAVLEQFATIAEDLKSFAGRSGRGNSGGAAAPPYQSSQPRRNGAVQGFYLWSRRKGRQGAPSHPGLLPPVGEKVSAGRLRWYRVNGVEELESFAPEVQAGQFMGRHWQFLASRRLTAA